MEERAIVRNERIKIPKPWELVLYECISMRKAVKMVLIWTMKRVDDPFINR